MLVNTRFGARNVEKSEKGYVRVEGLDAWFLIDGLTFQNRRYGRFSGTIVNTVKGRQAVFAHNGHSYADPDPIAAFAKMAASEL